MSFIIIENESRVEDPFSRLAWLIGLQILRFDVMVLLVLEDRVWQDEKEDTLVAVCNSMMVSNGFCL